MASFIRANGIFVITSDLHYFSSLLEYTSLGFLQLEVLADITRTYFPSGTKINRQRNSVLLISQRSFPWLCFVCTEKAKQLHQNVLCCLLSQVPCSKPCFSPSEFPFLLKKTNQKTPTTTQPCWVTEGCLSLCFLRYILKPECNFFKILPELQVFKFQLTRA